MKKTIGIAFIFMFLMVTGFSINYYQTMVKKCKGFTKQCPNEPLCQKLMYDNFNKQDALSLYTKAFKLSFEPDLEQHYLANVYEHCASVMINGCSDWLVSNHTFQ